MLAHLGEFGAGMPRDDLEFMHEGRRVLHHHAKLTACESPDSERVRQLHHRHLRLPRGGTRQLHAHGQFLGEIKGLLLRDPQASASVRQPLIGRCERVPLGPGVLRDLECRVHLAGQVRLRIADRVDLVPHLHVAVYELLHLMHGEVGFR